MGTDHCVRLKLPHVFYERLVSQLGEGASQSYKFFHAHRVVCFSERKAVEFRSMFQQFEVALVVNPLVEARRGIQQIEVLDRVAGAQGSPGFRESDRCLQVPAARRDRRNENTHWLPQSLSSSKAVGQEKAS